MMGKYTNAWSFSSRYAYVLLTIPFLVHEVWLGTETIINTPVLQGPDESRHINNNLYGYQKILGFNYPCGTYTQAMGELISALSPMPFHAEIKMNAVMLSALHKANQVTVFSQYSNKQVANASDQNACSYASVFSMYYNNILPIIAHYSGHSLTISQYILTVRFSSMMTSICLCLVLLIIITKGRFLIQIPEDLQPWIRLGTLLAFFLFLNIPLAKFMMSVVNQEYLLIPLGIAFVLGFFLRVPKLSEFLFVLGLLAFLTKPVYLPLGLMSMMFHYSYFIPNRRSWMTTILICISLVVTVLAVFVVASFCGKIDCGPLKGNLFIINNPQNFWSYYWQYGLKNPFNIHWLKWVLYFGGMGWIDAHMPSTAFYEFAFPIRLTLYFTLLNALVVSGWQLPFIRTKLSKEAPLVALRQSNFGLALQMVFLLMVLDIMLMFCGYIIVEVMAQSCKMMAQPFFFGACMQGRYMFPLTFHLFLVPYLIFTIGVWLVRRMSSSQLNKIFYNIQAIAMIFATVFQIISINFIQLEVLNSRYFPDEQTYREYQKIVVQNQPAYNIGENFPLIVDPLAMK